MAASGMHVMALVLAVAAAGVVSTAPSMSTTPATDPTWTCPEVTVQANASLQQIVGDWFVLQLEGYKTAPQMSLCSKVSLTDLHEVDANRSSLIFTVYWAMSDGSRRRLVEESAVSLPNHNQEFVSDTGAVWRVHSVSGDGRVVVLAACYGTSHEVLWFTLGVAPEDVAPAPRRAANAVRRDAKLCLTMAALGGGGGGPTDS